jgi:hypothetical protein
MEEEEGSFARRGRIVDRALAARTRDRIAALAKRREHAAARGRTSVDSTARSDANSGPPPDGGRRGGDGCSGKKAYP